MDHEADTQMLLAPHEVIYVSGKQTQWLDYLSSPVVALAATAAFSAVALQDGSLNVYSATGRRYVYSLACPSCTNRWNLQNDADYEPRVLMLRLECEQAQSSGHHIQRTSIRLVRIYLHDSPTPVA